MKLTADRVTLKAAAEAAARICAGSGTSLPVLRNLRLDANGKLSFGATDLDLGTERPVAADVPEAGMLTVPAAAFVEALREFEGAEVSLAYEEADGEHAGFLVVSAGRSEIRLQTLPAEQFPSMPEVEGVALEVPKPDLKRAISRTLFAVSKDETRPMLTGALLQGADGVLRLATTDTHRLGVATLPVSDAPDVSAILPGRFCKELLPLLEGDGIVSLTVSGSQVEARVDGSVLSGRQIDGTFPRFERVIPSGHTRRLVMDRAKLAAALRRVRIVAREAPAANRVLMTVELADLVITAEAGSFGNSEERVEAQREGDFADFQIAFNCLFVLDFLAAVDCAEVAVELSEPLSPSLWRPSEGAEYLHVIMPMAVQ